MTVVARILRFSTLAFCVLLSLAFIYVYFEWSTQVYVLYNQMVSNDNDAINTGALIACDCKTKVPISADMSGATPTITTDATPLDDTAAVALMQKTPNPPGTVGSASVALAAAAKVAAAAAALPAAQAAVKSTTATAAASTAAANLASAAVSANATSAAIAAALSKAQAKSTTDSNIASASAAKAATSLAAYNVAVIKASSIAAIAASSKAKVTATSSSDVIATAQTAAAQAATAAAQATTAKTQSDADATQATADATKAATSLAAAKQALSAANADPLVSASLAATAKVQADQSAASQAQSAADTAQSDSVAKKPICVRPKNTSDLQTDMSNFRSVYQFNIINGILYALQNWFADPTKVDATTQPSQSLLNSCSAGGLVLNVSDPNQFAIAQKNAASVKFKTPLQPPWVIAGYQPLKFNVLWVQYFFEAVFFPSSSSTS